MSVDEKVRDRLRRAHEKRHPDDVGGMKAGGARDYLYPPDRQPSPFDHFLDSPQGRGVALLADFMGPKVSAGRFMARRQGYDPGWAHGSKAPPFDRIDFNKLDPGANLGKGLYAGRQGSDLVREYGPETPLAIDTSRYLDMRQPWKADRARTFYGDLVKRHEFRPKAMPLDGEAIRRLKDLADAPDSLLVDPMDTWRALRRTIDPEDFRLNVEAGGHPGIMHRIGKEEVAVTYPSGEGQVRRLDAKFDPKKKGQSGLLLGTAAATPFVAYDEEGGR